MAAWPAVTVADCALDPLVNVKAAAAVPLSAAVCGLPVALSLTCRVAERFPEPAGLNTTPTVQLAPMASVAPQVLELAAMLKSPELAPAMEMGFVVANVTNALPVLVIVTVVGLLDVPWVAVNAGTGLGVIVTGAPAAVPVPESTADCGLPAALSVTTNAPSRTPVAVGLKVSETMQLPLAASVAPQLFEAIAKSPALAPPSAMPLMFKRAPPVLPMVTVIAALVAPCAVLGKPIVPLGVKVTTGALGGVPVPVKATNCGLPLALSATARLAVRAPVADGVKVIDT